MYLAVCTRPDIAHAVSILSQFNDYHGEEHWSAAKRVLRYLKGTMDIGLSFTNCHEQIIGFADADWGGDEVDRKSYSGFTFIFGGGAISWESRKQKTVALSSTEAEFVAVAEATQEALHFKNLLRELGFDYLTNIKILNDNRSAQELIRNRCYHARTKHIDIKLYFIRDTMETGTISVEFCPTDEMAADVFTKGLPCQKHWRFSKMLGLSR